MHQLFIKSSSKMSIDLYSVFLKTLLIKAKVSYSFSHLPKTIKRYTLLKSPHVYKKAKEHFEKDCICPLVSQET